MKNAGASGTRRSALTALAAATLWPGSVSAQASERAPSGLRITTSDLGVDRIAFQTRLLRRRPSPQPYDNAPPPVGVEEIEYPSGNLKLKAWFSRPAGAQGAVPAVVFAHGGFAYGAEDFEMARPYVDAGFAVLAPMLRGENGLPGSFTMFFGEVDDVVAAAAYVKTLPNIDASRVFLSGHSVGGTLAMLAAQSSTHFHASAAFSGSPDQITFCEAWSEIVPFDRSNPAEFEIRSPLAYASSFKAPARLFYASGEIYGSDTELTARIAQDAGRNVQAAAVRGNHFTAVPEAMRRSIVFFREQT